MMDEAQDIHVKFVVEFDSEDGLKRLATSHIDGKLDAYSMICTALAMIHVIASNLDSDGPMPLMELEKLIHDDVSTIFTSALSRNESD